jgi:hypothetical protein
MFETVSGIKNLLHAVLVHPRGRFTLSLSASVGNPGAVRYIHFINAGHTLCGERRRPQWRRHGNVSKLPGGRCTQTIPPAAGRLLQPFVGTNFARGAKA